MAIWGSRGGGDGGGGGNDGGSCDGGGGSGVCESPRKAIVPSEVQGAEQSFHPEKLSSMFLEKIKEVVGATFGRIGIILSSGTRHNLTGLRMTNEPTYTASARGSDKKVVGTRVILILDVGRGILMCLSSLLRMKSFVSNLHLEKSTWVKKFLATQW